MKLKKLTIEICRCFEANPGKYKSEISYEGSGGTIEMLLDENAGNARPHFDFFRSLRLPHRFEHNRHALRLYVDDRDRHSSRRPTSRPLRLGRSALATTREQSECGENSRCFAEG